MTRRHLDHPKEEHCVICDQTDRKHAEKRRRQQRRQKEPVPEDLLALLRGEGEEVLAYSTEDRYYTRPRGIEGNKLLIGRRKKK